jgi:hypothetical protein
MNVQSAMDTENRAQQNGMEQRGANNNIRLG